jgi:hypothetical protein
VRVLAPPQQEFLVMRAGYFLWGLVGLFGLASGCSAMGLTSEEASAQCSVSPARALAPPAAAALRLTGSQAVAGQRNIAWVWLASPTLRYPHAALGSREHAGSLHVVLAQGAGPQELVYRLPPQRVFEDRIPRLVDLDGDGRDEIVLIESDALRGAALVVFGVPKTPDGAPPQSAQLVELARSPYAGSTFRWANPVGFADFDGDGRLDVASVITPHVGGVLTLYHYRPPILEAYAQAMDVSNHRMGNLEQGQAAIVALPGLRPTVIVPDMTQRSLHALRWEAPGQWKELAEPTPLPARVERITALPGGACALLADGSWWRLTLSR